ncbi:MAG: hypothetical protein GY827_02235 [Cytophagales bacterium]|nr:hypothetical protein [Cytophagales bacterium]
MSLYQEIIKNFPSTIIIPSEMKTIVEWYENSDELMGGLFEFYPDEEQSTIQNWFGKETLSERFGVFGIMLDGAPVAFWLDEQNVQKIIMLGSEGDCQVVLADNFLDFIRLIAIGYDDFYCFEFDQTIIEYNQENEDSDDEGVNKEFQQWLQNTFQVTIPEKGNEIVNIEDYSFSGWVEKQF